MTRRFLNSDELSGPTVKNMCDGPKEKNQHERWNAPTKQFNLKVVADRWEQG